MVGTDTMNLWVDSSQAGCSIESPAPTGMKEGATVILMPESTVSVSLSPFAVNSVTNGGSSALFATSKNLPSVVSAISSTRVQLLVVKQVLWVDTIFPV